MANKGQVIFDLTSEMHNKVTQIYEEACDGQTQLAIEAVEALQEDLKEFKKNLKQEDE